MKADFLLGQVFEELQIEPRNQKAVRVFLSPLKLKHPETYAHCIRVGILAKQIAVFVHLNPRNLLYAGLLHDVGKAQVPLQTLAKTDTWTPDDMQEMKEHVMLGYRLIRDRFDFSAEIILWHHRFQKDGYPTIIPKALHEYCEGTKVLIAECGRMLAIADVYDALHRKNDKFGTLNGEQIKGKMFQFNNDRAQLVKDLYDAGIFTTD